jgi:hypothetical protein
VNPEAGFIDGPFRERVQRIARANPKMPAVEVIQLARGNTPTPEPVPAPKVIAPSVPVGAPLEFEF